MKWNRRINLFCGLIGMCLATGLLGATDVNGSFRLPFQAQWESVTLPAGDYTFSLDHATQNGRILLRRGDRAVALIIPQGMEVTAYTATSSLVIVGNAVRSLHLAPVGLTYQYQVHQGRKELFAGHSNVPGISVLVTTK